MILQIDTKNVDPDITVMQLTGKITLGRESQRIEALVQDLVKQNQRKFIFDLSGVTYIDSAGLGVITVCSAAVRDAGGMLHIAGATGLAQKLFHITRVDTVIPFYPTVEAAQQGF